ncbi:sulfurtransferase [Paenibacillus yanchengensis]|uniref:Sulfurtransferase n=1 Tax=Paenibacillus yanchengensis TaxID=2035833 RepID=A0ABW4YGF0_9BACL
MKNIVTMKWLLARMYEANIVIVDCRFIMGQPDAGRQQYEADHIPGAVYLDMERDLSGEVAEHGGRHPLPDMVDLTVALSKVGISNESQVIIYDDQGGAMASRLWWLLKYAGHEQVSVMDQGYSAWKAAGFPISAEQQVLIPAKYLATVEHPMLVEMDEVKELLAEESVTIIDSREAPRYRGEVEPLDKKAGHIPGAVNYFWKDGFSADGKWNNGDEQAERFSKIDKNQEVIVYCGSGVTATPNIIALTEAGYNKVRLYAGSWSDWISYEENPVAVGEE